MPAKLVRSTPPRAGIHAHAHSGEHPHPRADIDGIAAEPIQLRHDESVLGLRAIHELREAPALRNARAAGNCLRHDPVRLNMGAYCFGLPTLVFDGLAGR